VLKITHFGLARAKVGTKVGKRRQKLASSDVELRIAKGKTLRAEEEASATKHYGLAREMEASQAWKRAELAGNEPRTTCFESSSAPRNLSSLSDITRSYDVDMSGELTFERDEASPWGDWSDTDRATLRAQGFRGAVTDGNGERIFRSKSMATPFLSKAERKAKKIS
jgi:hypothetical protein